jgi:hypothetical protein
MDTTHRNADSLRAWTNANRQTGPYGQTDKHVLQARADVAGAVGSLRAGQVYEGQLAQELRGVAAVGRRVAVCPCPAAQLHLPVP